MRTAKVTAVQHAAWIGVQRVALIASGLCYAALVPRLMGPDHYGRFALLGSMSVWVFLAGECGMTQALSRFLPDCTRSNDTGRIRATLGNVLALRIATGLTGAIAYIPLARLVLPDMPLHTLAITAVAIPLGAVVEPLFALHLGLNRAARWGLGFVIRRWLYLVTIPTGYILAGLTGAVAAIALTETIVLAAGVYGAREYLSADRIRFNRAVLGPLLRFGLVLFAGNLIHATFRLSGETLVRLLTGDYREVGFYGLPLSIYVAAESGITQLATAFVPFFSGLMLAGDRATLALWTERLLRGMTVMLMPALFGSFLIADRAIPILFGAAYADVAPNLFPIMLTLLALVPGSIASMLSQVHRTPSVNLAASAIRLASFWGIGIVLIPRLGSLGGVIAACAGTVLFSAWMMKAVLRMQPLALGRWVRALALGAVAAPLALLKSSAATDASLFVAATLGYGLLVFVFRIVTWSEMRALASMLTGRGATAASTSGSSQS